MCVYECVLYMCVCVKERISNTSWLQIREGCFVCLFCYAVARVKVGYDVMDKTEEWWSKKSKRKTFPLQLIQSSTPTLWIIIPDDQLSWFVPSSLQCAWGRERDIDRAGHGYSVGKKSYTFLCNPLKEKRKVGTKEKRANCGYEVAKMGHTFRKNAIFAWQVA